MRKIALFVVLLSSVSLLAQTDFTRSTKIKIILTSLSLQKYGPMKPDRTFHEKETVYINLKVIGLKANEEGQVVVQADLSVPEFNLNRENILDTSVDSTPQVPMCFYLPIESVTRGGTCHAKIVVRDMLAGTFSEFNTSFNIAK